VDEIAAFQDEALEGGRNLSTLSHLSLLTLLQGCWTQPTRLGWASG
jgi:hypothetical protein